MTDPDPILAAIARCALHRAPYFDAADAAGSLLSSDPRYEALDARADELGALYFEALAEVYAIAPRTPEGLFALIDVFVAEEDGKVGEPLPRGLPEIFAATKRLLGAG